MHMHADGPIENCRARYIAGHWTETLRDAKFPRSNHNQACRFGGVVIGPLNDYIYIYMLPTSEEQQDLSKNNSISKIQACKQIISSH